jgi:hypothetical protein
MSRAVIARLTTPNGRSLCYADIGEDATEKLGGADSSAPVEIALAPQVSKAGNTYFEWDLNGVRLPDGFATGIVVEGQTVAMGIPRESKKGNLTSQGRAEVLIDSKRHVVKATIVKSRRPYWVKVMAHVKPVRRS